MQKNNFIIFLLCFLCSCTTAQKEDVLVYKDKDAPIENRVEDLLARMTLKEKVMQMTQWTYGKNANPNNIGDKLKAVSPEIGSLIYRSINPKYRNDIQRKAIEESRLGIPVIFGFDAIHGYKTIFPIPLAQACAWDTEMVRKSCATSAKECWLSGVDWTFSPMVDVARDPRWGRVSEGYGEDVYANSVFAAAAVKGYQGDDLAGKKTIAACLKHYIGYSLSEGGRDYHYSDVSDQTLWETFLPPFKAGVDAGAVTLMSAFNDISGIPASANHYTLTEVLKERWGHKGFVVSDWGSVKNLIRQGFAKDEKEAGYLSLMAGVEMDMVDDIYLENLEVLVEEGTLPIKVIDEAVRRILRVKFMLGSFDTPYVDELPEDKRYFAKEDLALAEQIAAESMVLLKNENNALPITKNTRKLAIIGPMVNDSLHLMGSWEGMGVTTDVRTISQGLEEEFGPGTELIYARGCDFYGEDQSGFKDAKKAALSADKVVVFLGEKKKWSGENGSRSTISLPEIQEQLVEMLAKTGKPIILVLSSGRPLELVRLEKMSDAMLEIWQPGTMGGPAVAGILSGRYNPSGKLAITFPRTTGQIPMYYNMRTPARNMGYYQDVNRRPMYWFGHGLSYTTFEYEPVLLSADKIKKDQKLVATLTVKNTGKLDGKESVLWYITDPVASITRPRRELKFFEKKMIKSGESVRYEFEIDPFKDLSFYDKNGNLKTEEGSYILRVGDQKVEFEVIN